MHRRDDLLEQRIARGPIDRLVKLPVLVGRHAGAGSWNASLHDVQLRGDDGDVRLAGALGAKRRRLRLQRAADFQRLHQAVEIVAAGQRQRHVQHIGRYGRLEIGAAALPALDKAEPFPARQRLAHGIAADLQAFGEDALGRQLLAGPQRLLAHEARQRLQHRIVASDGLNRVEVEIVQICLYWFNGPTICMIRPVSQWPPCGMSRHSRCNPECGHLLLQTIAWRQIAQAPLPRSGR